MSGILESLDMLLIAVGNFMLFVRGFWDTLPPVVQAMIFVSFGLFALIGFIRMVF